MAQEECFKRGSSSLLIIEDEAEAEYHDDKTERFWTAGKREMIDEQYIDKFYWETYPSFSSPTLTRTEEEFPWNDDQPSYRENENCVYFNTDKYAYLSVLLCKNDIRIRTDEW